MGHPEIAQGVEIVSLDEEIRPRPGAGRVLRQQVKGHEILIQRPVVIDLVPLPDQPELGLPVPLFNDPDQLFF